MNFNQAFKEAFKQDPEATMTLCMENGRNKMILCSKVLNKRFTDRLTNNNPLQPVSFAMGNSLHNHNTAEFLRNFFLGIGIDANEEIENIFWDDEDNEFHISKDSVDFYSEICISRLPEEGPKGVSTKQIIDNNYIETIQSFLE